MKSQQNRNELVTRPASLQSHHVNDIEGTAGFVAFDAAPQSSLEEMLGGAGQGSGLSSYDETALVNPAFRVLKTMVQAWMREISQYRNVFADHQVVHFYRWLRSPNALLYDPGLATNSIFFCFLFVKTR